jgi:hypothetical protein
MNFGDYPRIDEIVDGIEDRSGNTSFYITTPQVEIVPGSPAEYVSKNLPFWLKGRYNDTKNFVLPQNALFLDIETTGLGKDKQIWLAGTASVEGQSLVLTQFLARDPSEEQAIINAFFCEGKRKPCWISFNGPAFDHDRLYSRAELHQAKNVEPKNWFDVYSFYRKQTRGRLTSNTLQELELVLFPKFKRKNHIKGKDIPKAYFNYVANGDPQPVKDSMDHNAKDIMSTVAYYLMILQETH